MIRFGVLQHFVIHRDHHAFDRRQQLDAAAFARDGAELLSLAHPAIQVGDLDGVDLAEQLPANASMPTRAFCRPSSTTQVCPGWKQ